MKDIIAFTHIPKTGGTTVRRIFQNSFGIKYFDVKSRTTHLDPAEKITKIDGDTYGLKDIKRDLKIHPGAKCVGGHEILPFSDVDKIDRKVRWFTMLRDPIERFLSHFQYANRNKDVADIYEWVKDRTRERESVKNIQTLFIAGRRDVNAAKQILSEVIDVVGLMEHFNASMVVLKKVTSFDGIDIKYANKVNKSKSSQHKNRITKNIGEYKDFIYECNSMDIEVYEHVRNIIWERQLDSVGKDNVIEECEQISEKDLFLRNYISRCKNYIWRNIVYGSFYHALNNNKEHIW